MSQAPGQQDPLPLDFGITNPIDAPPASGDMNEPDAARNVASVPVLSPEVGDERWPFSVQVIRSARRKRTVGAQMKGDVLTITVPSWMSKAQEVVWRDKMAERYRRKIDADRIDLHERSSALARRYDLPRPLDIRWADEMKSQWGSCTPAHSSIRLSSRLAAFPNWVLDYVIMHELVHLVVLAHNDEFWRIVNRYPKAERAIGYLIARSNDSESID